MTLIPLIVASLTLSPARPNIIVILCDDLGYGDLSCYGAKSYKTPNIDKLAANGVRLTSYYSGSPGCSPARAALMTGCYPQRVGFPQVLMPKAKQGLAPSEETLPEVLRAAGYRTSMIGKWHLGDHPEAAPTKHGFEAFYGLPYSNDMWPKNGKYPSLWLQRNGEWLKEIRTLEDQAMLTTLYTDEAIRTIHRNQRSPFFLYLAHSMPHVPIGAQPKFRGATDTPYGDSVLDIDHSVGRIQSELKRLRLDRNTLIVFTSDNGPWSPYGDHSGSSGPFRGHKGTSFEGGMRVPFIVSWPVQLKARVSDGIAASMDLLPTLASFAGAEHRPKLRIDGLNLSRFLGTGGKSPREDYFYYYPGELRGIRVGPWKLQLPHRDRVMTGVPGKDGKSAGEENLPVGLALYNLSSDPGERKDLAASQPQVIENLMERVQMMRIQLGDSLTKTTGKDQRPPQRY